jgi:copper transport protein
VYAHAQLVQSDPAPESVFASPPVAVTLLFTEAVTPAGTGIKVFSPAGNQVASAAHSSGSVLMAAVDSAEVGTYVVSWQVYSSDTHPSRGAFRFVVGRPSPNPYSALLTAGEIGTATPLGLVVQALSRWVHFMGFALAFGVVGYQALIHRKDGFSRLVGIGVALLVAAEPLALLGQLASLSFDGDTTLAVLGSGFGRLLGLRLGAALLAWTLMGVGRSSPMLAVGFVVALLDGASAHAIAGLPGAGQALVAVHVAAMGLWVGGLAAFIRVRDRRFGRYAAWTLGIAVVSGLLLAFAHTGFGVALVTTDYGRVLLIKVLIVVAALLTVTLRRPRLELGALVAIVAAAAVLAALPPPR